MKLLRLTAVVKKEKLSTGEDVYVALCYDLDIAGQGFSVEEAKANLREAVGLFVETASPSEVNRRLLNKGENSRVLAKQSDAVLKEDALSLAANIQDKIKYVGVYGDVQQAEFEVNFVTLDGLKASVAGRNYDKDILIGDGFPWIYRVTIRQVAAHNSYPEYSDERAVSLSVERIEAYGRSVDVLGGSITGRLFLAGDGYEQLKPADGSPWSYDLLRATRLDLA